MSFLRSTCGGKDAPDAELIEGGGGGGLSVRKQCCVGGFLCCGWFVFDRLAVMEDISDARLGGRGTCCLGGILTGIAGGKRGVAETNAGVGSCFNTGEFGEDDVDEEEDDEELAQEPMLPELVERIMSGVSGRTIVL